MKRFLVIGCFVLFGGVVHAQSAPASDALAARIKAMAEIPSTYGAVYSHDGKRIAFLSSRSGTPQVWLVDAAGGTPKQITQGADPVGSVAWSPVGDTIAYDVARGGGFNAQVFLSKPDGSDAKRITSGGKEDNFAGAFAPDGRFWFRSNVRNPEAPDSWIYDPKTGKAAIAIEYQGLGGIEDIRQPGNRALRDEPMHVQAPRASRLGRTQDDDGEDGCGARAHGHFPSQEAYARHASIRTSWPPTSGALKWNASRSSRTSRLRPTMRRDLRSS